MMTDNLCNTHFELLIGYGCVPDKLMNEMTLYLDDINVLNMAFKTLDVFLMVVIKLDLQVKYL